MMSLSSQPYEIISQIASYLDVDDILNLRGLNRKFNNLFYDKTFWSSLASQRLFFPEKDFHVNGIYPAKRYVDIKYVANGYYCLIDAIKDNNLYFVDIAVYYNTETNYIDMIRAALKIHDLDLRILDRLSKLTSYLDNDDIFDEAVKLASHKTISNLLKNPDFKLLDSYRCEINLLTSIRRNYFELFQVLVEDDRFDPTAKNNHPIGYASAIGQVRVVDKLLKFEHVDPSDAIWKASEYGHIQIVQRLMADPRVNQSARNCALIMAAKNGHLHVVNMLLEDPLVNPTTHNNEPFNLSYKNGHYDIARILMDHPRFDKTVPDYMMLKLKC